MGYVSPDAASVLSHINSSIKSSPSFHSWNKNHSYQASEWVVNFMENLRSWCWPHRPLPTGCLFPAHTNTSCHSHPASRVAPGTQILLLPWRVIQVPPSFSSKMSTLKHIKNLAFAGTHWVIFLMYTCIVKKKKKKKKRSFKQHTDKKLKIAPNSHYLEVSTTNVCGKCPTHTPLFYTNGITLSLLFFIFSRHH